MKFKQTLKTLLKDPRHWLGWLLSAAGITAIIYFFVKISLAIFIPILVVEVLIDIIKHQLKLQ